MIKDYRYIVVEGNIGAGKTTLAAMLAEELGGLLIPEEFADNTFLPQFYREPERFAFPLELSFLAARYNQLKAVFGRVRKEIIISDYHFHKSLLFAKNTLNADEFTLFSSFFDILSPHIPEPDVVIFLKKDVMTLIENIRKRNRGFETALEASYLEKINQAYAKMTAGYPFRKLVVIESDQLDFVKNPDDFKTILNVLTN